jgi:2-succinyl-6-hydroxy-2,4-cyclohexadiene-1-carboxylate synthase
MEWHKQLMNDVFQEAVNGLTYRVHRWGNSDTAYAAKMKRGRGGRVVRFLLHGFSGAGQNWARLAGLLSPGAAFAPDLIGHSGTASPTDPARYAMAPAAADLFALWSQLGMPPVHLIGYSMGGRLALYTALTYPAMVARLTLESASPGLATETERAERRAADESLADRIAREGMAWFAMMWEQLPLFQYQSPEVRTALREVRLTQSAIGLANSLRGMGTGAQPSLWERLGELTMPVDLIVGEHDSKFAAINQQMAAQVPGAQLYLVAGAGHSVHQEQPEVFAALLP